MPDESRRPAFEIEQATRFPAAAPTTASDFDTVRLDDFLGRMRDAVLATVRRDGGPQATPIWYHWDGQVFRMSTPDWTAKTRNVRRDDRVSICVDDPVGGMYVTVFGRAEIIEGDRDRVRAESWPILLRYLHPDEAAVRWARIDAGRDRVVLKVRPDKVIWRDSVR